MVGRGRGLGNRRRAGASGSGDFGRVAGGVGFDEFVVEAGEGGVCVRDDVEEKKPEGEDGEEEPADEGKPEDESFALVAIHDAATFGDGLVGAQVGIFAEKVEGGGIGVGLDDAGDDEEKGPESGEEGRQDAGDAATAEVAEAEEGVGRIRFTAFDDGHADGSHADGDDASEEKGYKSADSRNEAACAIDEAQEEEHSEDGAEFAGEALLGALLEAGCGEGLRDETLCGGRIEGHVVHGNPFWLDGC